MEAGTGTSEKSKPRAKGPTTVARRYFQAINDRDLDAAAELWEPGGIDRLVGMAELAVPGEFKQWFSRLFAAFPDYEFEVLTIAASKEHAAVRWRATGTFDGNGKFEGMNPNGASIEIEGCDMLTVRDGKIVENHAYLNATEMARQLGAMPPAGSVAEKGMIGAVNAKTATVKAIQRLREQLDS
jgi:steroid delta-isomerase-like uncharacterized protein